MDAAEHACSECDALELTASRHGNAKGRVVDFGRPLAGKERGAALSAKGERLIWMEARLVDKLTALRGHGESYSNVSLRLVEIEEGRGSMSVTARSWTSRTCANTVGGDGFHAGLGDPEVRRASNRATARAARSTSAFTVIS